MREQLSAEMRQAAGAASNLAVARSEEHAEKRAIATAEEAVQTASRLHTQLAQLEGRLRSSEASAEVSLGELRQLLQGEVRKVSEAGHRLDVELRAELRSELRTAAAESRAESSRLAQEFHTVRSQGLAHEWCIPRCMQRLRYLSLAAEPGLWLDSEVFSLGSVGPLTLRLYPRGLRGGDGQCAAALRLPSTAAVAAPALHTVELSVADLARRVQLRRDPEGGGSLWLAEGLGDLGVHTAGSEAADLAIRVQVPIGNTAVNHAGGAGLSTSAVPPSSTRAFHTAPGGSRPAGPPRGSPSALGVLGSTGSLNSFGSLSGRPTSSEVLSSPPPRFGSALAAAAAALGVSPMTPAGAVSEATAPSESTAPRTPLRQLLEAPQAVVLAASVQPAWPSVAQQRARLEQRARAAFELPQGLPGSAPGSSPGSDTFEVRSEAAGGSPTSPTNPFDDSLPGAPQLPGAPPTNPFDGNQRPDETTPVPVHPLEPAGASNAT